MTKLIGTIEDAIISRIKAAHDDGTLGYTLRKIDTYGGEFAEAIERAAKKFPAVICVYNGDTLDLQRSTQVTDVRIYNFILFCCAVSLRNESATRKGAGGRVGSYQLADDMRALFREVSLPGFDAEPVRVISVRSVMNDKPAGQLASIYAVDLQLTVFAEDAPDTASLDRFAAFHANWDIPAFRDDIQSPLPADDKADATDHVILPQED